MELYDFIIKSGIGKNTTLDNEYRKLINQIVLTCDEEKESRWETYNLIIKEILNLDNGKYFEEIKYRLTDGENPNDVLLDILSRYDSEMLTHLAWFLKKRVEEYADEDFFRKFYE